MEEWRPIAEFPGLYEVSSIGRVRSLGRTIMKRSGPKVDPVPVKLKPHLVAVHLNGKVGGKYLAVNLCPGDGKIVIRKVHKLVCFAFHGPAPSPQHQVNHRDLNKLNCSKENLEWLTPSENVAHWWAAKKARG